jgi:hypothetical protein
MTFLLNLFVNYFAAVQKFEVYWRNVDFLLLCCCTVDRRS